MHFAPLGHSRRFAFCAVRHFAVPLARVVVCPIFADRKRAGDISDAARTRGSSFTENLMAKLNETEWIWRGGEFVRWQDATVHVLCHSLQFGSSVFEGIRCYSTPHGPAIFRLEDHLQRLLDSARIYRMDVKRSEEQTSELQSP